MAVSSCAWRKIRVPRHPSVRSGAQALPSRSRSSAWPSTSGSQLCRLPCPRLLRAWRGGNPLFQTVEIGQHQFGFHHFGIGDGIDLVGDMLNIVILEAAQHVDDGVQHFARILPRNWLPRPSPLDAPRTSPAISTKASPD
ncbi:MAG: hypothetical protein R3D83_09460 [Caenibius sp.]